MDLHLKNLEEIKDLAVRFLDEKNYEMYLKCLMAHLEISPDDTEAIICIARCYWTYMAPPDYGLALEYLHRAIAVDANCDQALKSIANIHYVNGNYIDSMMYFQRVLLINPRNVWALMMTARICYMGRGVAVDYDIAYDHIQRALDVNPDCLCSLDLLAHMYGKGRGVRQNVDLSLSIGKRVYASGEVCPLSCLAVGSILCNIKKNYEEALPYLAMPNFKSIATLKKCLNGIISSECVGQPLKPKTIEILTNLDLNKIYDGKVPSILLSLVALVKHQTDLLKLHFEYSVEGKGFEEAKSDFYSRITDHDIVGDEITNQDVMEIE